LATPDIIILVIILISALLGLSRGLLTEVFSLATWVAAFLLAIWFAPDLSGRLEQQVNDPTIRLVVAYALVFVLTLIVGGMLRMLLRKLVETTGLSGTDRFLGLLFGSLRGVMVCIVALMMLAPFVKETQWYNESALVPEMMAFEEVVLDWLGKAQKAVSDIPGLPKPDLPGSELLNTEG